MNCFNCNRKIKHSYTFEGEIYGKQCWKKIALPRILAERQKLEEEWKQERFLRQKAKIEVLKVKDLSKIRSDFKLRFIPSVIEQFAQKGYLSNRQIEIATDMFNNRDYKNYWRIAVQFDLNNKQNLIECGLMEEKDF